MLVREDSQSFLKTLIRGVDEEHHGKVFKIGEYLTGWMLNNRRPFISNDIPDDERLSGLKMKDKNIQSILSVPMILRGQLIGVINLFNKKNNTPFNENDQKLMSIIAAQVASFLSTAKTFEQVQESKDRLQKQTEQLQQEVVSNYGYSGIIGESESIKRLQEEIKAIAQTPASVLITGETGTGKELVAKTIHYNSDRRDKPFVDVNSSAIPDNLVESEFFGIESGVATGVNKRIGLFEQAHEGTLFIDEIGDMNLTTQAKILRVLQERQFRRVGSNHNIEVDVRVIAATNKDLKKEIEKGLFRDDLFYRLSIFQINLPSLRQRKEDIPLLANHFLNCFAGKMAKIVHGFSEEAEEILIQHDWNGNVRELANVVERAVILARDEPIQPKHLPSDIQNNTVSDLSDTTSFEESVIRFKKQLILKFLQDSNNNKAEAARRLNISRAYLFRLLKQFEI